MNVETTVPTQETVPESIEPSSPETTETAPETIDGAVETESSEPETVESTAPEETEETIWEDLSGAAYEETVAETTEPVIIDVIESTGSYIATSTLFSGFLVCGTLIGLALLRDRHGN